MDNIYIGKIVNTHGIKGELRIKSDFEKKSKVFEIGKHVIVRGCEYTIVSYRKHKDFDMVTFEGFNDINQVLFLKGSNVFIKRDELGLDNDEYLLSDLIDFKVICNGEMKGIISDYSGGINPLLSVNWDNKSYFIPLNGNFIIDVNIENREVIVSEDVEGLIL